MSTYKKVFFTFSFIVICFLFSGFLERNKIRERNVPKQIDEFQKDFLNKEQKTLEYLDNLSENFRFLHEDLWMDQAWVKEAHDLYYSEGIILAISRSDSIFFLSNNALPLRHGQLPQITTGLEFIHNGWYYLNSQKQDDFLLQVFFLIKKEYRYRNKFLINEFHKEFNLPDFYGLSADSAKGFSVYNKQDDFAISIIAPDELTLTSENPVFDFLSIVFALGGLLAIIYLIFFLTDVLINNQRRILALLLFPVLIILGRAIMFYFQIPTSVYDRDLFSAAQYATSHLLPSLGDLLINVVLVNVIFYSFYFRLDGNIIFDKIKSPRLIGSFISILLFAILALYAYFILQLLEGLVINSHLNLNVNFIFNLDIYSILGFLIIAGFFFSYYFISKIIFRFLYEIIDNRNKLVILSILFLILLAIACAFLSIPFFFWLLFATSVIIFIIEGIQITSKISLSSLIVSFFIFAVISTYALFHFNQEKEIAKRQNVALRISSEHDPIAEYLFLGIENDILDDYMLNSMVIEDPFNEDEILSYLKSEYFNEFWSKYDIQITTCSPGEVLIFKPFDVQMVCDDYFSEYIEQFGKPTLSEHLIYLDNNTGRNSYVFVIPVFQYPANELLYSVYVEFEAKFVPKELGFPELLVDEQIDITRNLGDYSYAIYKDEKLTNRFGTFLYSVGSNVYNSTEATFAFFELDGYSHLMYTRDEETKIVVSKQRETLLQKIAPFSYLFILFLFLTVAIWSISLRFRGDFDFSINFKKRLQFSMIGIVLVSVMAIGGASSWFIFNIYKNKNEAFINEKAHSILIELENQLAEENYLNDSYYNFLKDQLISLSNVFFTDINLYHPQGILLASSRPRVFDEGLISPMINPVAFNQLKISRKSLFVHNEKIGNLEYISAYVPLRNIHNQLIAYINLPYFAQQSELRNEISFFLVAFINIYLLLLLLTVILAFFISNYVTRPLQIIRDSLSTVSFGKSNKKIEWTKNDEIGQLISEYNRMIDELAVSAELLARSERESAWREMAKQVAHEIKNPLTPMRLSVQYLEKAWYDKAEDWDERLEKFSKTMVEQIDTLSLIANQFSDFAKTPVQNNEVINLNEFIPEVLDLYKDFANVSIEFQPCTNHPSPIVSVDKKQLLRVFNNLIKNSTQAYDKNEIARISINCTGEDKYYRIEIQDFGSGIPDHLKSNIFQPYFTTKTAGMGLGLAMVKGIIQSFNGHISFDSRQGYGTSFIIRIPSANNDSKSLQPSV